MSLYMVGGKVCTSGGKSVSQPSGGGSFDYYIGPSGSDSNNGLTTGTPWAITALASKRTTYTGKTIGFLDGTYNVWTYLTDTTDTSGLDVDGGTNGSPTILKAVTARQAVFNAKNGATYGNGKKGNIIAHTPAMTHQGYLVLDGLKFVGFTYKTVNIGIYGVSVDLPGIVIKNCEVTDCNASQMGITDNVDGMVINNCLNALIQNNYIHDNVSWAVDIADHLTAIMCWQSKGTVIEYNTCIAAGSVYGKEISNQGTQVRYNYVDVSNYPGDSAEGIKDWTGYDTGGLTLTSRIHHNVVRCNGNGLSLGATLDSTHGWTTPVEVYNNTVDMIQQPGGPPPYVESGLWLKVDSAGYGGAKVYNNIMTGVVSIDNKMFRFNALGPNVWDYNLWPTSMAWRLQADSGAGSTDYSSLASLQSAVVSAGGISNLDSHKVQTNTPGFTGSGTRADVYKLSGGAAAQNAGKSDGTTGGTTCDMGAWGNSPPTRIGCDF